MWRPLVQVVGSAQGDFQGHKANCGGRRSLVQEHQRTRDEPQSELGRTIDKVSCRRVTIDSVEEETTRHVAVKGSDGQQTGEVKVETSKVTKGMAYSACRHFVAAQNYLRDEDAVETRDTKRLLEGDMARLSAARSTAKFVKLAVEPTATAVKEFVKLMQGKE